MRIAACRTFFEHDLFKRRQPGSRGRPETGPYGHFCLRAGNVNLGGHRLLPKFQTFYPRNIEHEASDPQWIFLEAAEQFNLKFGTRNANAAFARVRQFPGAFPQSHRMRPRFGRSLDLFNTASDTR
jgi:hypothetical protein